MNQQMTDEQLKAATIMAMAELFRAPLTDVALQMYVAALADLTPPQVAFACAKLSTEARFRPVPAEIREAAGANEIKPADRAALAFEALKAACSRVGSYRSADFDDPLINAVVRHLGGWTRACDMPVSEFDLWYRKEFIATYEMFCRTGASPEQIAPLEGESEMANRQNGFLGADHSCRVPVPTGLPWAGRPIKRLNGGSQAARVTIAGPTK